MVSNESSHLVSVSKLWRSVIASEDSEPEVIRGLRVRAFMLSPELSNSRVYSISTASFRAAEKSAGFFFKEVDGQCQGGVL